MANGNTSQTEARGYIESRQKRGLNLLDPYIAYIEQGGQTPIYQGPRVAGFTPDQLAAQQGVRNQQGSWQPYFQQAAGAANQASAQAGSAARPWTEVWRDYQNPYEEGVVKNIWNSAKRQLTENVLPDVERQFITAGQPGSSRHGEFTRRALRDAQESAMRQEADLRQSGWGQNAGIYAQDAARRQQAAGQFGDISRLYGNLAGQRQEQGYTDLSALGRSGQTQQQQQQQQIDAAKDKFYEQRDVDWNRAIDYTKVANASSPAAGSKTTTGSGGNTAGQIVGTVAGGLGTLGQLGTQLGWFADGGYVDRKAIINYLMSQMRGEM